VFALVCVGQLLCNVVFIHCSSWILFTPVVGYVFMRFMRLMTADLLCSCRWQEPLCTIKSVAVGFLNMLNVSTVCKFVIVSST
jgi:hypothetical protein